MKLKIIAIIIVLFVTTRLQAQQVKNFSDLNIASSFYGIWEGKIKCAAYNTEQKLSFNISPYKKTKDSLYIVLLKENTKLSVFDSILVPVKNGVIQIPIDLQTLTNGNVNCLPTNLLVSLLDSAIMIGVHENISFPACAAIDYNAVKTSDYKGKATTMQQTVLLKVNAAETKAMQQWLITSLKNYLITNKGIEKICSPQYHQFKEEGFKTMDDEINYDDYEKKWSKIYGKESFCGDCPYFIAAQDLSSKITVEAVFKENKEDGYWFNVTINDPKMKAKYNEVIKVIKSGSSYLIDDVIMKDL